MKEYVRVRWMDDLVITSVYRKDGGTHHAFRAIDIAMLENGKSEELRKIMNKKFMYDPDRPHKETVPALDHGTAPHFHIQVWIT